MRLAVLILAGGIAWSVVASRWPRLLPIAARVVDGEPPTLAWWPVAVVAGIVALVPVPVAGSTSVAVAIVVTAALTAVGMVNHARTGARALTAGIIANGMVIIANDGMPVAASAVMAAGGSATTIPTSGPHHLLTEATALPWLADSMGIGWLGAVISPGDLLLAVGGVAVVASVAAPLFVRTAPSSRSEPPTGTPGRGRPGRDLLGDGASATTGSVEVPQQGGTATGSGITSREDVVATRP